MKIKRAKMKKLDLANVFVEILKEYPDINVNLVTYFDGLPELEHLNIL